MVCPSNSAKLKEVELPINGEMAISEIIEKYPFSIEIMLSHGLHCVGCHANVYETLESGSLGHGMEKEEYEIMLDELNTMALRKTDQELQFSEKAIEIISNMVEKENKKGLKIKVVSGGCAGFSYDFSLEDKEEEGDKILEFKTLKVYIDEESFSRIKGSYVDYVTGLSGAGVKISNPNAKAGCACGNSFR